MMQSPARPGQYHPEVYQQYPQQQAVGQYGHHGYGTPTMHYPHGDSDPHALYHAAQEQFNGGAESESWFDSVLASEDEAGEETGPGGAPGRGGVHRRGAVPFRQSSGRAAPLREGSNRSIVSLGSGPPLDHGYLDMGQGNGPSSTCSRLPSIEAQGIKVEGMPSIRGGGRGGGRRSHIGTRSRRVRATSRGVTSSSSQIASARRRWSASPRSRGRQPGGWLGSSRTA